MITSCCSAYSARSFSILIFRVPRRTPIAASSSFSSVATIRASCHVSILGT